MMALRLLRNASGSNNGSPAATTHAVITLAAAANGHIVPLRKNHRRSRNHRWSETQYRRWVTGCMCFALLALVAALVTMDPARRRPRSSTRPVRATMIPVAKALAPPHLPRAKASASSPWWRIPPRFGSGGISARGFITTTTTRFAATGERHTGTEHEDSPTTSSPASSSSDSSGISYRIRDCEYRELSAIAALVVESFYDSQRAKNLVARKLYQLAETNRLQQNFPYPESRTIHRMLVVEATSAIASEEAVVVGFCDVDARPCATKVKLPRPYLSDLAIDPDHRRRGLARKLVEFSEDFIRGMGGDNNDIRDDDNNGTTINFGELWIRVASDNTAALGLYQDKLGYSLEEWSTGEECEGKPNNPEVWTLRKNLCSEPPAMC